MKKFNAYIYALDDVFSPIEVIQIQAETRGSAIEIMNRRVSGRLFYKLQEVK